MTTDFARVRTLFEAALEAPAAERAEFVRRECGSDDALRAEVLQLLASDTSTTPMAKALDGTAVQMARIAATPLDGTIGGFRLLRVLGSGGMGTVYVAEQQEPRRQVALKVLSLGLLSPNAVARFRFEAELLARLQHPGIAQVHAAGLHRQGEVELPWFALELVPDAHGLVDHAERQALSLRARLELVLQACDAVHHGHLHGVVHRDLKPPNVLVDASGRVKVIDFGIARSTQSDAPAPPTEPGLVYGTLAYMSPEQLGSGIIDHRTDVWALGVITFELLAGRRPFEFGSQPSWRLAESVTSTPAPRLSSLVKGLPADLDVVLAKALRAQPGERYESAAAFAADLRAVLAERPVLARPASTFYHVRLFARRRRGVVAALAAVVLTVVVALVVLAQKNFELRQQQIALEREQAAVLRKQRLSDRIARFARDFLTNADVRQDHGADYTVRQALDQSVVALERESFAEPEVEAELRELIGDAYRGLSLPLVALPHLQRAGELFAQALGADAARTLAARLSVASARSDADDIAGANAELDALLPHIQKVLPADDPVTLRALHERAYTWRAAGRLREAEGAYREVLALRERVLGRTAEPTIVTLHNLGTLLLAMDKVDEAHAVLTDCLSRSRAAGEARTATWQIADSLAEALALLGRLDTAIAMHREAMAGYATLLGPDHELTLGCAFHLVKALHRAGDREGLRAAATDLLPRCERTFGPDHRRTMDVLAAVALTKMQAGDYVGAVADLERALAAQRRSRGPTHPDVFLAGQNLATAQLDGGLAAPALVTTQAMVADLPAATDVSPIGVGYTHLLHARALAANSKPLAAAPAVAAALERLQTLPAAHPIRRQAEALSTQLKAPSGGG